jgi:ATP phosphoribosyltransferase regulatory subunit
MEITQYSLNQTSVQNSAQASALIPRGVADYFWTEAYQRRRLEAGLLETFRTWGYEDVIPPMFEYAETVSSHANRALQAEMMRFQDRDGSTLALRADMTIAVARLVGTRLHDWPMPQRFCYAGSVFRNTELQAGRQREFLQAGIELLGAPTAAADAEILALTAKALRLAGVADFQLIVGQMGYLHSLLEALQLSSPQQRWLQQAIDRNSEPELADFLRAVPLEPQQRRTVEELPRLSGQNIEAILTQTEKLCLNQGMHKALDNLRAICGALDSYRVLDCIYLDLTEIHNLGYYTGLTFEVLTPRLGFPIAAGGRYDHMIATFGKAQAAVGAAFTLDRILMALGDPADPYKPPKPVAPDLLVATHQSAECLAIVEQWRMQGIRVAVDVSGDVDEKLWRMAQQIGSQCALIWTGDGFDIYAATNPLEQGPRYLAAADSVGAIKQWVNPESQ